MYKIACAAMAAVTASAWEYPKQQDFANFHARSVDTFTNAMSKGELHKLSVKDFIDPIVWDSWVGADAMASISLKMADLNLGMMTAMQ